MNDTIDHITESFTKINGTFRRIDASIDDIKHRLEHIDALMQRKNCYQENRPSCIPGFYKAARQLPLPPTPPNSPTSSNGVRVIRSKHYR